MSVVGYELQTDQLREVDLIGSLGISLPRTVGMVAGVAIQGLAGLSRCSSILNLLTIVDVFLTIVKGNGGVHSSPVRTMMELKGAVETEAAIKLMALSDAALQVLVEHVVVPRGKRRVTIGVVILLIVERGAHIEVPHTEVTVKVMTSVQRQVLVALGLFHAVVGIARRQEVLAVGLGLAVKVSVCHLYVTVGLPYAVTVFHIIVNTCLLLGQHTAIMQALRVPTATFTWFTVTVQVVGRGVGCHTRMVGETEGKESGQPPVFCAATSLHISQCSDRVFLLQLHVHHVAFVIGNMLPKELALISPFVINLDGLHSIGGQIFEHNGVVATKKVLAIKKQSIDVFAVMVDSSTLFQFYSWQLSDKCVKHRPFGQLESVGIENKRVALIIELHLGSRDHHLLQHL